MSSELKYHVVIVTVAGKGHLLPMVSLADSMTSVDRRVAVSIVVPQTDDLELSMTSNANVKTVSIVVPPEGSKLGLAGLMWMAAHEDYLKAELHKLLDAMEAPNCVFPRPNFVLYDMFATYTQDVCMARGLGHGLCVTSPLPFLYAWSQRLCLTPTPAPGCDPLQLPGLGPLPRNTLPDDALLPPVFESAFARFEHTKLALVNDCAVLYRDGENTPLVDTVAQQLRGTGERTPVYLTGMWASFLRPTPAVEDPVLAWLDTQTPDSVVFVALGSWCPLPDADMCELARGLELCGRPFLWAYRPNMFKAVPPHSPPDWEHPEPKDALGEDGLPVGFEDAVRDRAKVARWVDQPRILAHPAVACFVTHCGWNSLTEALTLSGKPLIALPLGAEQHMNAHQVTDLLGFGRKLWGAEWPRALERNHVAATINQVLSDDALKARVYDAHQQVKAAWNDGVSTHHTKQFLANHVYSS